MGDHDLLLDTHMVVWLANDPSKIPARLLNSMKAAERRFVSHVTALEIQIKNTKNPASFLFSLNFLRQAIVTFSLHQLPLTFKDIQAFGEMNFLHADPFDRLLMAQAANRNITLATVDRDILRTAELYRAFRVLGVEA